LLFLAQALAKERAMTKVPDNGTNIVKKDHYMAKLSYALVMRELKLQLKKSRISYARLANMLDISESTLKKWFIAEDGNFNRINMICELLGIPVHAVIRSVEEQKVVTLTLPISAQGLFNRDFTAFKIYWLLVYERMHEDEILQLLKIKPAELKSILFKLDKERLIEIGLKDKIKVPKMKPVRWKFSGSFMEKLLKQWVDEILEESQHKHDDNRMILQFFQLSPPSAEEFKKDLDALEDKYARRTILELNTYNGERRKIRYLVSTASGSYIK
jgi:transcriptional regulator with XRE-family HTH domain